MPLQRHANGSAAPAIAPPIVHDVLRSPGQPLDEGTQTYFTSRFGHDFSHVRVHTDQQAAESARAVGALAYTVGNNVVFGAGHYSPANSSGRRLLAHELTHVVQQGNLTRTPARVEMGEPNDAYEREADMFSAAMVVGGKSPSLSVSPQLRVQRSIGGALRSIGSALLDALLFIPRLFGLEYFPAADLREYLAGLKQRKAPEDKIFSDNKARACVSRENEFGPYDTQTKTWLVQEMLGGHTSFLDEGAIITLLRRSQSDRAQIVASIGRERIWSKFSGRNRRIIEAMTLTAADAGEALVSRLRGLNPDEIAEYDANATDPAVKESIRRAGALANITAPVPSEATVTPGGQADFTINGVHILARQDQINLALIDHGFTHLEFRYSGPGPIPVTPENANQPVSGLIPAVEINGTIWTEFPSEEAKHKSSAYGVGTRPQDEPTLRYHERSHGEAWLTFFRNTPPPAFKGTNSMLPAQFNSAVKEWNDAMDQYGSRAADFAQKAGDCVGRLPTDEQLRGTGFTAAICHQE
ncbi:MAG: DUF4157 domain-containing protein [Terriglobales bacterium]